MILSVGLTGGIASGKSTILGMLRELGCRTTDADAIVADLYRSGRPGHQALVASYGNAILLPSGEIDRKQLAAIAFSDPAEAARLNALIHPLVLAEERRLMAEAEALEGDAIQVIEATLLLEAGGRGRYDRIVVVDIPPETQVERAMGRGMTREEALRRMAHQMSREERLRQADYVIDNGADAEAARRQVIRLVEALRADLLKKKTPGRTPGGGSHRS